MTITSEQQFQLDMERERNTYLTSSEGKRIKLEAIRVAKEVLIENARSTPIKEEGVSAEEIINFAQKLIVHIEA